MKRFLSTIILSLLILIFTSCEKPAEQKPFITDVALKTKLQDEKVWLEFSAMMNLKTFVLPSLQFPVIDFRHPEIIYGKLYMAPSFTPGESEIAIDINLTELAKLEAVEPTLPNGGRLPIGGVDRADVIEIQIPQIHGTVYIALNTLHPDKKVFMSGFALSIPQADGIGTAVGPGQLFPHFTIKNVLIYAGVYTSDEANKTGIGVFSDLSSVISKDLAQMIISQDHISAEDYQKALRAPKISSQENQFLNKNEKIDYRYARKLQLQLGKAEKLNGPIQVRY